MSTPDLPPWARKRQPVPAPPPRPASGSVRSGPGAQPGRAAGAEPPFRLSSILQGVMGRTLDQAAEYAFQNATRDQLLNVAQRMVELDAEKALASSFLIAWAASGRNPEVPYPNPGSISWLFQADHATLRLYAAEIVRMSPESARWLAVALEEELDGRDQGFSEHARAGA